MDYKNLKIPSGVKKRMDILKGHRTYGEYLDAVIGYFEMTGVDATYGQLPPAVTIVKAMKEENTILFRRMEDMIKILRNIETTKIDLLLHGVDSIIKGKSLGNGVDDSADIGPKEEEIYQLIKINDQQEGIITKLKEEIKTLKMENSNLKINNCNKAKEVVELVEELLSERILGKEGILTKEYRVQLIEKIKRIADV